MFNIGFTELVLVGVIALIFIGPQQLPELARTVGRLLNEFKRATTDFQSSVTSNITQELQTNWQETRKELEKPYEPPPEEAPFSHDVPEGEGKKS